MSVSLQVDQPKHNGKAKASMILGIIGGVAWIIPILGVPITITGLVLGVMGLKSDRRNMAKTGLVLSVIFFVATIINAAFWAYKVYTGHHS